MLCAAHTDCIDNGTRYEGYRLGNLVTDGFYRIYDRKTGEIYREVEL